MSPKKIIMVARAGAPHGVRGLLKLHPFLEDPESIHQFKHFYLRYPNQAWQEAPKLSITKKGQALFVHFENFDQPETAGLKFTHAELGVTREELPALLNHQYYWEDLADLNVINQQGQLIGVVDHLMTTPAHDVLVLKGDTDPVLIPYVWEHFIIDVDLTKKQIIVDWDL